MSNDSTTPAPLAVCGECAGTYRDHAAIAGERRCRLRDQLLDTVFRPATLEDARRLGIPGAERLTDTTRPAGGHELTEALARAYYEPLGWDMDDLDPDDLRECMRAMEPVAAEVERRILAARGADAAATDDGLDWGQIVEVIASDSARRAGWEANDYDSDDPVTWGLAFRGPAERAVEIVRTALNAAPAPTEDQSQSTCSCGSPDAYSLNRGERIVHRSDGPCYFAPTEDRAADVVDQLREHLERLEDVEDRWRPVTPRLGRRARDKASGIRLALRLLGADPAPVREVLDPDTHDLDPRQER